MQIINNPYIKKTISTPVVGNGVSNKNCNPQGDNPLQGLRYVNVLVHTQIDVEGE